MRRARQEHRVSQLDAQSGRKYRMAQAILRDQEPEPKPRKSKKKKKRKGPKKDEV